MVCSKPDKRVDSENREFKTEWTDSYAFVLPVGSTKSLCLICNETVAIFKSGNLKRHYNSKHGVAWVLRKHKKSFSDSEIVKECMKRIAIALTK